MNLAVLMTCHNRRETTLSCLEAVWRLRQQVKAAGDSDGTGREGQVGAWDLHLFLVDDGSTDGTSAAVVDYARAIGADQGKWIHLIQGDGALYWARGMELAWMMAIDAELQSAPPATNHQSLITSHQPPAANHYTHFLWLNDDTKLNPSVFASMRHCVETHPNAVVVGGLTDASTGEKICGLKPNGLFTGNFVLVPRCVYEQLGMICGEYRHAWADSDYAMQCKRAGVEVVELENVGTTEAHDLRPSLAGLNLRQRWHLLFDPKGWCLHDLWLYRRRNWGICAALGSCVHMIWHVLVSNIEALKQ